MILKNKISVILGATGVIGEAIVKEYAKEGSGLIIVGRNRKKLNEIRKKYKNSIIQTLVADVSSLRDLKKLKTNLSKKVKNIDVVVIATGIYGEISNFMESDPQKWARAIEVNLLGTVWSIHYLLPFLKKSKRGKIIVFAGGGEGPLENFSSYVSSKGGILRFVETVASEFKKMKIEINAISPGLVNSGFVRDIIKVGPKKVGLKKYKEALRQIKNGEGVVSPESGAELVVFLGSRKSDGLSGRYFSAVWDNWREIPKHKDIINKSDIYTLRRIKPKDRGYDWK